jgi:recombination protein RecT
MARQTTTADRTQTASPREAPADNLPANQQAQAQSRHPLVQFREYVNQRMTTLEEALPPYITPKKFVSVVMTALQTKPDLLKCTFPSLWNACVRAAHDGLLPDGREGAIAPYGESADGKRVAEIATWMPMVEGFRKKIFETGKVKSWEVNVVYEKDEFDYQLGDNAFITHKPAIGLANPGGIVGGYSIAKLTSGETVREVMSAFQINQVKAKSKALKGPWSDAQSFPEMCKKTVARRHYKQLPHSESLDAIFARDDQENGFADPEATPIAPAPRRAISSQVAMDQYAGLGDGETLDHETGEVTRKSSDDAVASASLEKEAAASSAQSAAASNMRGSPTSEHTKEIKDAGTTGAATGETRKSAPAEDAGGSSQAAGASQSAGADTNTSGGGASPGAAGAADAKRSDTTAAASAATPHASDSQDIPESDDLQLDGADRPWPPGSEPTDLPEYERYLKTKLASFQFADDVAPWWNSSDEKTLRLKCKVEAEFTRLQSQAIERRKQLPARPKE